MFFFAQIEIFLYFYNYFYLITLRNHMIVRLQNGQMGFGFKRKKNVLLF